MTTNISLNISLGWFIRFGRLEQRERLKKFYIETLGLPFLRAGTTQEFDLFWAGEALLAEVIWEYQKASPDPLEADPATAQTVPIYRVHEIDALVANLRANGVTVLDSVNRDGYLQAFILDPCGWLIGLRQLSSEPQRAHDLEAARRWLRGETFNPGCRRMPASWQELGWITHRVKDLAAMTRFYSSALGLTVLAANDRRAWLDLGDNSILELVGGGRSAELPKNRAELPGVFVLRVHERAALKSAAREAGGAIVHDLIQADRNELSYVADPEGHLIGIDERYHPERYAPAVVCFAEDAEARRRWSERVAAYR